MSVWWCPPQAKTPWYALPDQLFTTPDVVHSINFLGFEFTRQNADTHCVLQRTCPVCFVDFHQKDMLTAGCSHFVCKGCWKTYLEVNINEKQKVMRLTCPALGEGNKPCPAVAPRSLLVKVAERHILEKLADYDDAMLVESNSRVSWCSQPGCKAVAMVDRPAPRYPMCDTHTFECYTI